MTISITDLQRDPQTLAMNKKSIQEAEVLNRAKDEGCLSKCSDIRRPYNLSESMADFVGKDCKGSQIEIEIKAMDGSRRRPYHRQTEDIIGNRKDLFDRVDDPKKVRIVFDMSEAPTFLHKTILNNVTEGLDSNQLSNVDFVFD